MFTGIIEEMGRVQAIQWHPQGARFQIQASHILEDIKIGDSLSVNGCCLTVVNFTSTYWTCDVVQETLNRTNFGHLEVGQLVNLERALRYQDRLGGHLVQGHIDGIGKIIHKKSLTDDSWWVTIEISPEILRYSVLKGSIAIDGVSLTIADLKNSHLSFAMIPHTAQVTTLGLKSIGEFVNLEVDLMAKYAEKFLSPFVSNLTQETHI